MLRLFGIFCVVLSCSLMGFWKSFQMSRRMKELKSLERIFMLLSGSIEFGGETLPEALQAISKKVAKPFAEFLADVVMRLTDYPGYSFAHIFNQCIEEDLERCALTKEDKKELTQAGEMLGYLDRNMQIQAINTYLKTLELSMKDLYEVLPERKKLYQSLGIMGGLMLGILLI